MPKVPLALISPKQQRNPTLKPFNLNTDQQRRGAHPLRS